MPRHCFKLLPSSLVIAIACTSLFACGGPDKQTLFPDLPAVRARNESDPGTHVLEFVRSFGTATGPLSFSIIGDIAVSRSGLLAATDAATCQVLLLNLADGALVDRIGGCGDGPGEFRRIRGLAFLGDTLVAFETSTLSLHVVTLDGTEVRRVSLASAKPVGADIQDIDALDSENVLVALAHLPSEATSEVRRGDGALNPDDSADLLRIVNAATGKPRVSFLQNVPASSSNPGNVSTGVEACGYQDTNGIRVAAKNQWRFEGVIFGGLAPEVVGHFVTPTVAQAPSPLPPPQAGVFPAPISSNVVCTSLGPLFWELHGDRYAQPLVLDGGRIELRDYAGHPILVADFSEADTVFHGRPAAALGTRVFFKANMNMDVPQILEFRIRPREHDDPGSVILTSGPG